MELQGVDRMRVKSFLIASAVSGLLASAWQVLRLPFDGPVSGPSAFLSGLLSWMLAAFIACSTRFAVVPPSTSPHHHSHNQQWRFWGRPLSLAHALVMGFVVELLTSIFFWRTPYSRVFRMLYGAPFDWKPVLPRADMPDLAAYIVDHVIVWALPFVVISLYLRRRDGRMLRAS